MSPIDSYLGSSKRDDLTFSTYKTHVTGDLQLALCSRTEMRGMDGIWFAKLKLQHFREKTVHDGSQKSNTFVCTNMHACLASVIDVVKCSSALPKDLHKRFEHLDCTCTRDLLQLS